MNNCGINILIKINMKYTDKIEKAIKIASHAHRNQTRKGSGTPYVSHLFSVMIILSEYTEDEDILVAGLLHDLLEDTDTKDYGVRDIENDFGKKVLAIVQDVSEKKNKYLDTTDEKDTWKDRKISYLKHLSEATEDAVIVSAADKLHNLLATIECIKKEGESAWNVFNSSKEEQLWFYREFGLIIKWRLPNHPLVERVMEAIKEL